LIGLDRVRFPPPPPIEALDSLVQISSLCSTLLVFAEVRGGIAASRREGIAANLYYRARTPYEALREKLQ